MSENGPEDPDRADDATDGASGADAGGADAAEADDGDTFGVGIAVDAEEFRFVVHVPSEIDSGWRDPEAFQRRVEAATWNALDKRETLRAVGARASEGDTVTLGTVTMRPDGTLVDHSLSAPGDDGPE